MDLPALPQLRQLKVASPEPLTPTHLKKLLAAPELQDLLLEQTRVSPADLAAVPWTHAHLKFVRLPEMEVTDEEMRTLIQRMKAQAPLLEEVRVGWRVFQPAP